MSMELRCVEVSAEEMVSEAILMKKEIDLEQIEVEFMLPFWIAAKNAKNPVLMCGQGADEVFGGYARFREAKNIPNLSKETEALLEIIPKTPCPAPEMNQAIKRTAYDLNSAAIAKIMRNAGNMRLPQSFWVLESHRT